MIFVKVHIQEKSDSKLRRSKDLKAPVSKRKKSKRKKARTVVTKTTGSVSGSPVSGSLVSGSLVCGSSVCGSPVSRSLVSGSLVAKKAMCPMCPMWFSITNHKGQQAIYFFLQRKIKAGGTFLGSKELLTSSKTASRPFFDKNEY